VTPHGGLSCGVDCWFLERGSLSSSLFAGFLIFVKNQLVLAVPAWTVERRARVACSLPLPYSPVGRRSRRGDRNTSATGLNGRFKDGPGGTPATISDHTTRSTQGPGAGPLKGRRAPPAHCEPSARSLRPAGWCFRGSSLPSRCAPGRGELQPRIRVAIAANPEPCRTSNRHWARSGSPNGPTRLRAPGRFCQGGCLQARRPPATKIAPSRIRPDARRHSSPTTANENRSLTGAAPTLAEANRTT